MTDNLNMDVTAGLDIGNGYVKGKLSIDGAAPRLVDMPSCVAWWPGISWVPAPVSDALISDFVNEMDCRITSSAILGSDAEARLLVGRRAVASKETPIMFDINNATPKCDDPLSYQLILSSLAGTALTEYYERTHELPTRTLHLSVYVAVALPITDYTMYRERYRTALMGNVPHIVHIKNFEREVSVEVTFKGVEVLPEGAAAQYAIADMGPEFMDIALDAARADGMIIDASETGETVLSYDNTVGIDIGEGTVNFPVFRNGRASVESSSSINKGYGSVLDDVVMGLRSRAYAPKSRKDLAEFMLKTNPNPRDRDLAAKIKIDLDKCMKAFVHDVVSEYNRVKRGVQFNVDVVYVYGGGANAVRDVLYPELIEASRLDDDIYLPVIWLDSAYSRDLNRNGLYLVATMARASREVA